VQKYLEDILRTFLILVLIFVFSFGDLDIQKTTPDPVPFSRVELNGDWSGTDEFATYTLNNVVVVFQNSMPQDERMVWASIFDEAIELLPQHIVDLLKTTTITFTQVGVCDIRVLGCYDSKTELIGMRTDTLASFNRIDVLAVLIHEIGHAIDFAMDNNARLFADLHEADTHRPTSYAGTNSAEDFAESFFIYVMYPSYLRNCCPERYTFMMDKVFNGIEYSEDFPLSPFSRSRFR